MLPYLVQRLDVVDHHAAIASQMDICKFLMNLILDTKNNTLITIKLLEAYTRDKVKRFIFASFSRSTLTATPISLYGIIGLSIESYIQFYTKHCGLKSTVLRHSNIYSLFQCIGVVPTIIKSTQSRKLFIINRKQL